MPTSESSPRAAFNYQEQSSPLRISRLNAQGERQKKENSERQGRSGEITTEFDSAFGMEGTKEPTLHHFSHEHALKLAISTSNGDPINCYGCNLRILPGKDYYTCKTCSFSLHRECSSMPRKTKHPGHPNHNLTLLVSHLSSNNTIKCKACGEGITDFYYNCPKCGVYFHTLCSALPLSAVISSHPHKLKMEFSPPYDFSCDVCHRASHKGWLYRCRFCEFDTHVSCAIKDQEVTPKHESNELMQLLVQKYTTATLDHEASNGQGNSYAKSGGIGLPQMKPFTSGSLRSPTLGDKSSDISAMISDDLTIPSYQLSDFCFSIDLLKSYTAQGRSFQENKDTSYQDTQTPPQVEAKIKVDSVAVPNKTLGASQPALHQKPADSDKPISNPVFKDPEKRLNEAFVASQNQKREVPKGIGSKTASKQQKTKPHTSSSSSLSWFKLFTCCYGSRH